MPQPKITIDVGGKFPQVGSLNDLLGLWYHDGGELGTFQFLDNGVFFKISSSAVFSAGTYTYDVFTRKGMIKSGEGGKITNTIEIKNGKLIFGGSYPVYIRDYVEQSAT